MNAYEFIDQADFKWHQSFPLKDRVRTPGSNSIPTLYSFTDIPEDLTGLSVLDIGTTNGGAAFIAERRGASPVVAVDIVPPEVYGVLEVRKFLHSNVEYVQADLYDLPDKLATTFDIVICWGVIYHLRDPLGGLDVVRQLAKDRAYFETAVCDYELPVECQGQPFVRYYQHNERSFDPTNWFAPTITCMEQWLRSSGFHVNQGNAWPRIPQRAMFCTTVAEPEWTEYTLAKMPAPYGMVQ